MKLLDDRPVKWEQQDGTVARWFDLVRLGALAPDNRIPWQSRLHIVAHAWQVPTRLLMGKSDAELLDLAIEFVTYWSTPGTPQRPAWLPGEYDSLQEDC
jgi:hypothetical protein